MFHSHVHECERYEMSGLNWIFFFWPGMESKIIEFGGGMEDKGTELTPKK